MLPTRPLKHAIGVALPCLLSLGHLGRMNLITLRDLVDRLLLAQRLQRYFTLKITREFTSLFHVLLLP